MVSEQELLAFNRTMNVPVLPKVWKRVSGEENVNWVGVPSPKFHSKIFAPVVLLIIGIGVKVQLLEYPNWGLNPARIELGVRMK